MQDFLDGEGAPTPEFCAKNYLLFDKIFPEMKELGPRDGGGCLGGGIPSAPFPGSTNVFRYSAPIRVVLKGFSLWEFIDFLCQPRRETVSPAWYFWPCLLLAGLGSIHTCHLLGVNYCVNYSVHTIYAKVDQIATVQWGWCLPGGGAKCKYAHLVQYNPLSTHKSDVWMDPYSCCLQLMFSGILAFASLMQVNLFFCLFEALTIN